MIELAFALFSVASMVEAPRPLPPHVKLYLRQAAKLETPAKPAEKTCGHILIAGNKESKFDQRSVIKPPKEFGSKMPVLPAMPACEVQKPERGR